MFSILIYQKQAEAPKNVFLRSVELTLASCQAKLKRRPVAKGRKRLSAQTSRKYITHFQGVQRKAVMSWTEQQDPKKKNLKNLSY
ncbi:hypothetical protein MHYP_G00246480 [Metynnis hypsauchen]